MSAWWNDNDSFFIITAIWHIKSPCQAWAGAFVIPFTPTNLELFFTLPLSQTLFVHGEQATDFANNSLVSSLAFPAEMTSLIRQWLDWVCLNNHFAYRINLHDKLVISSGPRLASSLSCCAKISTSLPEAPVARACICNFSSETFHWYQAIYFRFAQVIQNTTIHRSGINKCKLFVKANTVGYGLCSSLTSSWPKTDQRGVLTACSLVALLPLLALYVCLFLLTTSSLFVFMICLSYSLWMTHCNQTDNESLGTLASWPWETTF